MKNLERAFMKSNEKTLLILTTVLAGVLEDARVSFPTISSKDWILDIERIEFQLLHRGIGFLTQDLPGLDDDLTSLLRTGQLRFSRPMFGRLHKPYLFRGLWNTIVDGDGRLLADADPSAIFFIRTLANFAKKSNVPHSTKVEQEKINDYIRIESELPAPSRRWDNGNFHDLNSDVDFNFHNPLRVHSLYGSEQGPEDRCLIRISEIADYFCAHFNNIEEFVRRSLVSARYDPGWFLTGTYRHGPGASAEGSRFKDKYSFNTISPRALDYLQQYDGTELFDLIEYSMPSVKELSSKITLVPKDSRGPRIIAAEPITAQFLQQGGYTYLRDMVIANSELRWFINFRNQELSRIMARAASVDGSFATIDLKDASDRMSLKLVQTVFRKSPSFLKYLYSVRTPNVKLPDGRLVTRLRKFASQGNALTFPLQSIVYTIICLGSMYDGSDIPSFLQRVKGSLRVFGDDLIVPTASYTNVTSSLRKLGLRVNESKSFSTGFFRESCGGDYYRGYDVAPLRIRRVDYDSPTGIQSLIDVSNEAHLKGLWKTADALKTFAKRHSRGMSDNIAYISPYDVGNGYISFSGSSTSHLLCRWNEDLQIVQFKTAQFLNKSKRANRNHRSRLAYNLMNDLSRPESNSMLIQDTNPTIRIGWA